MGGGLAQELEKIKCKGLEGTDGQWLEQREPRDAEGDEGSRDGGHRSSREALWPFYLCVSY